MRYTGKLGCRYRGIPHEMRILHETKHAKFEVCQICNMRKRYNKGYKGRTDNVEYLKDHVRNFAQRTGATQRIYNKIYRPELTTIKI